MHNQDGSLVDVVKNQICNYKNAEVRCAPQPSLSKRLKSEQLQKQLPEIFQPSATSAIGSKIQTPNRSLSKCLNSGIDRDRVKNNRKNSDSSIKFRKDDGQQQQFKYSDIQHQNSSICLMISPPRGSTCYSIKKQLHTIYNHPAENQVKNKLIKKFEQKQKARTENKPLYARDELSKKIIRQLTKYDKDQIKRSLDKSNSKKDIKKRDQLHAVNVYLQGLLDMSPQAVNEMIDEALSKVITFYCSIKVRNNEQKQFGKKINDTKQSAQQQSKQQKRIRKKAKQFLKKTDKKLKIKTSDRNMEITGSKDSMIKLFQTQLGKKLYYHTFCHLWEYFMENNLEKESKHWRIFDTYKQSIILKVEGFTQEQ